MLTHLGNFGAVVKVLTQPRGGAQGACCDKDFTVFWVVDALISLLFGALPLVLLSLPATLTDRCIQLETCLSELLMPYEAVAISKSRYVVSFETSQQLEILEKYMQQQNNKQGSALLRSSVHVQFIICSSN